MKGFVVTLLLICILMPVASSQLIYVESDPVQLKVPCLNNNTLCSGSATCNITVINPNSSTLINDQEMTNANGFFTYDLSTSQTSPTGTYQTTMTCNDAGVNGYSTFDYLITVNGKGNPEGIVIITFVILFLILIAVLTGLILYSIGQFVDEEFNMWDLIFNVSAYLVIFAIYIFGKEYLANSFVNDFLIWVIGITAVTNVIIPMFIFVISLTLWEVKRKDTWSV